jgi:hypothetical protein
MMPSKNLVWAESQTLAGTMAIGGFQRPLEESRITCAQYAFLLLNIRNIVMVMI